MPNTTLSNHPPLHPPPPHEDELGFIKDKFEYFGSSNEFQIYLFYFDFWSPFTRNFIPQFKPLTKMLRFSSKI